MMARIKACIHCGDMLEEDELPRGTCNRCERLLHPEGQTPAPARPKKSSGGRRKTAVRRPTAAEPPPAAPAEPPVPKTILIIDDERLIVKFLTKRLEVNGYKVIAAFDGQEGFDMIQSQKPDLVLSDNLMPAMTGYDLVKKLRKQTNGTEHTPVIIMTAKPSMKSFFSDREIGAFIAKPIVPEDLLGHIAELLRKAGAAREKGSF